MYIYIHILNPARAMVRLSMLCWAGTHWAPGGDSDVLDVRITSETAPHAPELPTAVRGGNGPLVGGNIYNLNAQ